MIDQMRELVVLLACDAVTASGLMPVMTLISLRENLLA